MPFQNKTEKIHNTKMLNRNSVCCEDVSAVSTDKKH